jgi:hypothetical protein
LSRKQIWCCLCGSSGWHAPNYAAAGSSRQTKWLWAHATFDAEKNLLIAGDVSPPKKLGIAPAPCPRGPDYPIGVVVSLYKQLPVAAPAKRPGWA